MRGQTLEEAWPVYSPSRAGAGLSASAARDFNVAFLGCISFGLVVFSLVRRGRARRQWERRLAKSAKARAWEADELPPSTEIVPLEVRLEGSSTTTVLIGDDDAQFRLRARAGVAMVLDDGRRCTFFAGTSLKCTFPGFTLVTEGGKGSVGAPGGTTFYVVATLPPDEETPKPAKDEGHPFREASNTSTDPPIELRPVQDRYECRLDPAPVKRKRLAKILPSLDPGKPPRWRPYLYPGIPLAILWPLAIWGWPAVMTPILILSLMFLAIIEDGLSAMLRED